jgi:hypothetical protein
VAEEAIVYWLFVSEGEYWLIEFNCKNGGINNHDIDADTTSTAQRKKCGQHKMLSFLKHWWQLKVVVKSRCQNRGISEKWDEAWQIFAGDELELKKKKRKGVGREQSGMCYPHLRMCLALVIQRAIILLDWRSRMILVYSLHRLLMFRKN